MEPLPDELSPRRLWRRLAQLAAVAVVIGVIVLTGPGLGELRTRLTHASVGWLFAAVGLEALSALAYVVIFRAVFCPRMRWGLSYQIGMSEQGANSVLSVSGVGGLALGAWALHRGGMSTAQIGRKSVAFFLLTSLPNVSAVIIFAALFLVGAFGDDPDRALTYGLGAAALLVTILVLALPRWLQSRAPAGATDAKPGRLAAVRRFARDSLAQGIRDALDLLRRRSPGVLIGAWGTMAFDLTVLGACFLAFGHGPPLGVLVLGYLIGQLGGNLPVPGGVGGLDAGLIGVFVLYHQPLAVSTAAVLVYHGISLWVPGLLGSVAFLQLRRTLLREEQPAALCIPLVEPIQAVFAPLVAATGARPD
ncbi:MAG: flippase-like domain-containing protein [Acidobacteriota bacterium]|nr:flippase-like domain-containing protein [Acidobacteriota bacterium]